MRAELCSVTLSNDWSAVRIIDQTLLPSELKYIELQKPEELYEAICSLRVRGAPAIGVFAAYALYVLALHSQARDSSSLLSEIEKSARYLSSTRPTALNLSRQLDRMTAVAFNCAELPVSAVLDRLRSEAAAIHEEDMAICAAISEHGLSLVKNGDGILTHCNAGSLAASRYGTALGPILLGAERGIRFRVWCDETRPLLQGARLTSFELISAGVDTTLICDDMAASVMASGKIDACFVGCDRMAVNGDAANKIGTLGIAVLAKHFGIPFYVFCPSTTLDPSCISGADITIEMRHGQELRSLYYEKPMVPDGVKCFNPAFDITPGNLITAIVTEKGVIRPPYEKNLIDIIRGR